MDIWVQASQVWLNDTYGGQAGYSEIETDGSSGWQTMYALTRALQIELGISPTTTAFGPNTLNQLTFQVGDVSASTVANWSNVVAILQCALWCKGYWGHTEFGEWDDSITTSIIQVRGEMGLSPLALTVTPKMFKSLLTMSPYTLISGGTSGVRAIQQWLNGRYVHRQDFFLVPCDGLYSRDVQRGLMLAIQYEIGMADGVANGNFGPGTKAGLQTQGAVSLGNSDGSKRFVHLFQAALTFNQYPTSFDGVFGVQTEATAEAFQTFSALSVNGAADFQTWASLLVSTGDTNRQGRAADCVTTITTARATTLAALGYQIVGRYLTNYPEPNPLDKRIKPGELATIFLNGLAVFPIFQEGGDGGRYFSYNQGVQAGYKAHAAATSYGFKSGTTIYFAVDFDAYESEVISLVIPHFKGIAAALTRAQSPYKIGIYGARNTCFIVSNADHAELSFVGDMSTGYSGNLGYPLPYNWAFDQILEYSVGSGSGAIAIDKNIVSGRDPGQTSINSGLTLMDFVTWLHDQALLYRAANPGTSAGSSVLVLHYLRHNDADGTGGYDGLDWLIAAGPIDGGFIAHIDHLLTRRVFGIVSPGSGNYIGAAHMAATANGYQHGFNFGLPNALVTVADMTGWAGDLVQVSAGWINHKRANPGSSVDAYAFALEHIAGSPDGFYGASDFDEDIDGCNIARLMMFSDIDDVVASYYATGGGATTRYSTFLDERFSNDWTRADSVLDDIYSPSDPGAFAMAVGIYAQNLQGGPTLDINELTPSDWAGFTSAWVEKLTQKIANE